MVGKLGLPLLAVATLLTASVAGATIPGAANVLGDNWEVMVWTVPLTVSVDTASIATHESRITAHVLWDYAEAQRTRDPAAAPYKSMLGTVVFDCATERFGAAGSIAYSGDGGDGDAVAQYSINPLSARLTATEPGTIGRDLVTFVCAHAKAENSRAFASIVR